MPKRAGHSLGCMSLGQAPNAGPGCGSCMATLLCDLNRARGLIGFPEFCLLGAVAMA